MRSHQGAFVPASSRKAPASVSRSRKRLSSATPGLATTTSEYRVSILDAADDSELTVLISTLADFIDDWEQMSFPIPAAALGRPIRLEFRLQSDDIAVLPGWYIDDVQITVP